MMKNRALKRKMSNDKAIIYTISVLIIFAISVMFAGESQSGTTIFYGLLATIVMLATVHFFTAKARHKNGILVYGALFLFGLNTLCILDIILDSFGLPSKCGEGFDTGNCFLLDGLGIVLYYLIIPAAYVLGVIFLGINLTLKKPKKKKPRTDNPGLL